MKKNIIKYALLIAITCIFSIFYITTISYAAESTIDSIFTGEDDFISNGDTQPLDTQELHDTSNTIYNMLLAIAMVMAVAIGSILGIKFMISSVEDQAKIKELLVPYVAGCIVVFGSFGIWKIAVNVFKTF